ncbi:hypothetical protein PHET_09233 [Paragonimus heterotremus]|uniref:Leishmanolysin-like peptidase n=1 Tax=Paragonimus heterotremus TaxID=100268 RepID=A0A8J4SH70_9TREM|nr:hypothetical protein PHET_09233 [Paragonimus heterotremus]
MYYMKICWIYLSAIVFFGESNAYQHTCRSPTNQSIVSSLFVEKITLPVNPFKLVSTRGYANTVRLANSTFSLFCYENARNFKRTCIKNQYVVKNDADGIPHFYCTIGCASSPICIDEQIPDKYLSACREMVNDKPEVTIPEGLGYAGNDMVFIVDAKTTSDCLGGTLAYASACRIESGLDRPVLGYVNLCPDSLKLTYPEVEISYSTVVHELAHGLVSHLWSSSCWNSFCIT